MSRPHLIVAIGMVALAMLFAREGLAFPAVNSALGVAAALLLGRETMEDERG